MAVLKVVEDCELFLIPLMVGFREQSNLYCSLEYRAETFAVAVAPPSSAVLLLRSIACR